MLLAVVDKYEAQIAADRKKDANTGSMEPTPFLFYTFSIILLAASVAVITVKNPVHAALFLILSFFSASAI